MPSNRAPSSGFTLLETLLAAAVLALLALPILTALSRAAELDGSRIAQFEKHEFAISLLEEIVAVRDFSTRSGIYEDKFAFEVAAAPYTTETRTRYDDLISFTKLTITVDNVQRPDQPVEVSQIVARASQK